MSDQFFNFEVGFVDSATFEDGRIVALTISDLVEKLGWKLTDFKLKHGVQRAPLAIKDSKCMVGVGQIDSVYEIPKFGSGAAPEDKNTISPRRVEDVLDALTLHLGDQKFVNSFELAIDKESARQVLGLNPRGV